jgi:FAD:protein FMN transferase
MPMADDLHTLVVGREAMACRFEVACNAGELAGDTELAIEALDLVDRIEERISIYRPDSELSRINAAAAAGWVDVAADVWPLLVRARELWELTAGGFDIAAGPLVRAWGFPAARGPHARRRRPRGRPRGLRHPARRVRLRTAPGAVPPRWCRT